MKLLIRTIRVSWLSLDRRGRCYSKWCSVPSHSVTRQGATLQRLKDYSLNGRCSILHRLVDYCSAPTRTYRVLHGRSCVCPRILYSDFSATEPSLLRAFCTTATSEGTTKTEKKLLKLSPHEFAEFLKKNKLNRCFFIWSDAVERVVASHPELKEIEDWLNDPSNKYYRQHEAIFFNIGIRTGNLLSAFIWKITRGQACGGIRMCPYNSLETYLSDGLRLSRQLGVKSALAGLWIGGGKGIIPEPKDKQHMQPEFRAKLFYDYGDFVSTLNGCYIAGMDVGVNTYDLYNVHSRTRWAVCGPEDIGGSGNAAKLLAKGVICALEAALKFLGIRDVSGLRVAVQGAGGIGLCVVSSLLDLGVSHVYVTDASQKRIGDLHDILTSKAKGRLRAEKVPFGDMGVLGYDCDVVSPCAVGHVLTPETIPKIKAKIVCGAANSLLSDDEHAKLLDDRNITYVLEYLPNRMALVNSAYENYGRLYRDPLVEMHFNQEWEHSIYVLTKRVLEHASDKNVTVVQSANELAEEYSKQDHPLWPGRTKAIIQDLIARQWHHGSDFWRKRRNFATAESCA